MSIILHHLPTHPPILPNPPHFILPIPPSPHPPAWPYSGVTVLQHGEKQPARGHRALRPPCRHGLQRLLWPLCQNVSKGMGAPEPVFWVAVHLLRAWKTVREHTVTRPGDTLWQHRRWCDLNVLTSCCRDANEETRLSWQTLEVFFFHCFSFLTF